MSPEQREAVIEQVREVTERHARQMEEEIRRTDRLQSPEQIEARIERIRERMEQVARGMTE
jgi:hypothetical protein